MPNRTKDGDSFVTLRRDITERYGKHAITTDEFVSIIEKINDAEEDGTLTVQEVSIGDFFFELRQIKFDRIYLRCN